MIAPDLPHLDVPWLRAMVYGCLTVLLIAGVWATAQYLLARWYHEDLGDRDTPPAQ